MARKVMSGSVTGLAYRFKDDLAQEGGIATSPWMQLEPNEYSDYGGEVTAVTRNPISRSRQRKKGAVTDFDASGGFQNDFVTSRYMVKLLQGFFYATAFEKPSTAKLNSVAVAVTSVDAADGYAVDNDPSLGIVVGHLVLASGFSNPANNGLKLVSAVSATLIDTSTAGIVDEAAPPADARLEVVGFQFATADVTLDAQASQLVMGSTLADLSGFGLHPGEWVFLGDSSNAAYTFGDANVAGYARIGLDAADIAADTIVFDKTTWAPIDTDGAGKTIRMFFGTYLRNMTEAEIEALGDNVRFFIDLERSLGSDADGIQSQLLIDAMPAALTYTQPLSDKPVIDLTFVGLDEQFRTGADGLTAGVRVSAEGDGAFNSSTCVFQQRMNIIDPDTLNPTALFAYVQELELVLENNVTAVKAQGDIGGIDSIEGQLEIGGSATVFFATIDALEAIREYADVTFHTIMARSNQGYVFDLPLLTLGNGRLNVEMNEPITVPLDMAAVQNDGGYTASLTVFNYLPAVAMPVI